MAKTCIKCGKKIGLFSGIKCDDNNIRCDSCFEQYLKYKEKQIIKQVKKNFLKSAIPTDAEHRGITQIFKTEILS